MSTHPSIIVVLVWTPLPVTICEVAHYAHGLCSTRTLIVVVGQRPPPKQWLVRCVDYCASPAGGAYLIK